MSILEQDTTIPVIAIDGESGSGKGTAGRLVAAKLRFRYLDSGVYYRCLALEASRARIDPADIEGLASVTARLDVRIEGERIFLNETDETEVVRSDYTADITPPYAKVPEVRKGILKFQLAWRQWPGLVADGRDQGEIFTDSYRYYLCADPEIRARRRSEQLQQLKKPREHSDVLADLKRRDHADSTRNVAPLVLHPDALKIDTSEKTPQQVAETIFLHYYFKSRQRAQAR